MVSPSGDRCVRKIENCEVGFYEQPSDAFGRNTLVEDFENNRWICPNCSAGYYFNDDIPPGEQPYCEPCEVENCAVCELYPDKCDECLEDFIPNYRGDACIEPIEFCETNPLNYDHNGDVWICPQCLQGYFQLDDTCQKCTLDPFCTSCSNNQECLSCSEGKILNENEDGCIDPIKNCLDDRDGYEIDEKTGLFWCANCKDTFTWEFKLKVQNPWQCNRCDIVY